MVTLFVGLLVECLLLSLGFVLAVDSAHRSDWQRLPLAEPTAAKYFGFPEQVESPLPLDRVRNMGPEEFERRLQRGVPFIIEDAGDGNPFLGHSCEDFARRWPQAQMRSEYTGGKSEKFVRLGDDDWFRKDRRVRANRQHMTHGKVELTGPYVWHVKDGGHEAPPQVRAEVQAAWRPPYFVRGEVNLREANESSEFWFARRRGAVLAHADTYCIPAISLQLTGRKQWRLMPAPPLTSAVGRYDSHDGEIYRSGMWHPSYEATVEAGEAVVLFPNLFHETFVPEIGNPECTVATTFQVQLPVATSYLRAFLPTLATSHLYYEGHCLGLWHSYATLAPPGAEQTTMDEAAARSVALKRFSHVDVDTNGLLTAAELESFLASAGNKWARWFLTEDYFYDWRPTSAQKKTMSGELLRARARDTVAYLDIDGDNVVSTEEFEAAWWQWSLVHHRFDMQQKLQHARAGSQAIRNAEEKYKKYTKAGITKDAKTEL